MSPSRPGPAAVDRPSPSQAILEVNGVVSGYGSTPVLHQLSLEAGEGEITVVLGANGVGKTTLLRTVAGLLHTWHGAIALDGKHIHGLGAESRVRLGVGTVPEPPGVFRNLSVVDNLRVGALPLKLTRKLVSDRLESVLATFPALTGRHHQLAGSLSGGEQRMLAIGRALMGQPRLLLVDEASMGLSPIMVSEVLGLLNDLKRRGLSICMVEQDLTALDIADRAYVVEQGTVVQTARHHDLAALREAAAKVYLGTAAQRAG